MSKREDKEAAEASDDAQGSSDKQGETESGRAKVINKGHAKLVISEGKKVQPDEPRAIRPEPRSVSFHPQEQESDTPTGETVKRLVRESHPGKERIKVDQPKFEKLEERLDEAEKQEEQWGSKVFSGWWMVIAGACSAAVLLGSLTIKSCFDGDEYQEDTSIPPAPEEESIHAGSPGKWFHERSGTIGDQANAVLRGFMEAPDDVARSKWVRDPDGYLEKVKRWDGEVNPHLNHNGAQGWSVQHTGNTAFLTMDGKDTDFLPFRAYFTCEGEQLKLDWQATTAWSEVTLETMKKKLKDQWFRIDKQTRDAQGGQPESTPLLYTEPVLVRCMIRRRNDFYAGPYNDLEHSSYMLLSADKAHYLWAYTARDSALDLELRRLLDHGRFIVSLKKDIRVTLRIRCHQKEALLSQVELVEIVNTEWVTP
ncbi:MAG: hypothetical protein KJO21_09885 [Verrucomicrobiae bacterium]|nr:hypothetical protein [Verrucomicrobiae bacterium]NNJ43768.1 hypothetical protein [Akkermansiaceae bacterium]